MEDWEMADAADWIGTVSRSGLVRSAAALAAVIALFAIVSTPSSVHAQATADRSAVGDRSDAGVDASDARTDAKLGTLNLTTPANYNNLYATAPGAEQQAVRPQIRLNGLVPLNFDSNPLELGSGSSNSWGTFPVVNLSAAMPLGDLPFRV